MAWREGVSILTTTHLTRFQQDVFDAALAGDSPSHSASRPSVLDLLASSRGATKDRACRRDAWSGGTSGAKALAQPKPGS